MLCTSLEQLDLTDKLNWTHSYHYRFLFQIRIKRWAHPLFYFIFVIVFVELFHFIYFNKFQFPPINTYEVLLNANWFIH